MIRDDNLIGQLNIFSKLPKLISLICFGLKLPLVMKLSKLRQLTSRSTPFVGPHDANAHHSS